MGLKLCIILKTVAILYKKGVGLMLKQQVSIIRRRLAILLAVRFVVSLTATASSAESYPQHHHYQGYGWHQHVMSIMGITIVLAIIIVVGCGMVTRGFGLVNGNDDKNCKN
jgi:hypothetical protein